jgi:hypothetical protein
MKKNRFFVMTGILSVVLVGIFFVSNAVVGATPRSKDCHQAIKLLDSHDEDSYWDAENEVCNLRYTYPEFSNQCYPAFDQHKIVYSSTELDSVARLMFTGCSQ